MCTFPPGNIELSEGKLYCLVCGVNSDEREIQFPCKCRGQEGYCYRCILRSLNETHSLNNAVHLMKTFDDKRFVIGHNMLSMNMCTICQNPFGCRPMNNGKYWARLTGAYGYPIQDLAICMWFIVYFILFVCMRKWNELWLLALTYYIFTNGLVLQCLTHYINKGSGMSRWEPASDMYKVEDASYSLAGRNPTRMAIAIVFTTIIAVLLISMVYRYTGILVGVVIGSSNDTQLHTVKVSEPSNIELDPLLVVL